MTLSTTILLATAFLCLVLESVGAPVGQRKIGSRSYVLFVATAGVLGAAYYTPINFIFVACTALVIFSLMLGNSLEHGDAYALILVSYAVILLLCEVKNLLDFTVLTAFLNMLWVGLCYFRKTRRLVAEISLKLLFGSLAYFCFLSAAIILSLQSIGSLDFNVLLAHPEAKLALSWVWIALLMWIGSVPFLGVHVDYLDAAPSFASVLFLGGILITGGNLISVFTQAPLDPKLFKILVFFAGASLLVPPILALDQKRIARMIAYICLSQAGMVLLLALFDSKLLPIFYLHIAIAIPGALAGIRFWKHTKNPDKTWEDYAGAGRKHPYVSISWLYILSSLAGAPATLGFWLYAQADQVLILIVLAIVVSMIPIARLGVFMFGKPIRHELGKLHQPRQSFLIIGCALLLIAANIACLLLINLHETPDTLLQLFSFQF